MSPRRVLAIELLARLLAGLPAGLLAGLAACMLGAAGAWGQVAPEPVRAAPAAALDAFGAFGAVGPLGPPDALALAREGRQQLKAKNIAAAVAKLKEAVDLAEKEPLDAEELAILHYVYALALLRADKDDPALAELKRSTALNPRDTEVRVVLATQLLSANEPEQARREAELALQQGITDKDDLATANKVISDARSQSLHDKLSVTATVSVAFDSNVLQGGQIIQIANKSLRTQRATQALGDIIRSGVTRSSLRLSDLNFVTGVYLTANPPTTEWDLPINVDVDVQGRLLSRSKVELWLGYRFQQTLMTSSAFDHDDYNFQEHDVPLRLEIRPVKWLLLRAKAEGFVNFTGLQDFSPYQGGLNAGAELWFTESPRWRTRLIYQHQLRRSFDKENDKYLNGDRDEVRLQQELRLRGKKVRARGSLAYRLRSDRSGVFSTTQDLDLDTNLTMQAPSRPANCYPFMPLQPCTYPALVTDPNTGQYLVNPNTGKNEVTLGFYSYNAPLTYLAHELSTRWMLSVPGEVDVLASFAWEYFSYPQPYTATFTQYLAPVDSSDIGSWPVIPRPVVIPLPDQRRVDNRFTVLFGATKKLPRGFSLELTYSFLKNLSTVQNYVDNRSYDKHVVQLEGGYSF